jgi:hypothetical protein
MWNLYYSVDSTYRVLCMMIPADVEKQPTWFTVNQANIAFITGGINQANGQQSVWAVDTSGNLFQLFAGTGNVTSTANTKLWSFGARIREKSIIRAGAEIVVTGAATASLTARNEDLVAYTPDLQSVNPSTTFNWTNNGMAFNWTNGGNTFNWTTSGTQYELMEFNLPITVKKLGLDFTLTGAGAAVLAFAVEYEELPADWGH